MDDDSWLLEWIERIREHAGSELVLELGSGNGRDSSVLCDNGLSVIALDIAKAQLEKCSDIAACMPVVADISRPLPFRRSIFGVVLASLSLHYFLWQETQGIIAEIRRILAPDGMLLLRVNAVDDFNFGAGKGVEIEKNYYLNESKKKRFFDRPTVEFLLRDMDIRVLRHNCIDRYGKAKMVWEACAVA